MKNLGHKSEAGSSIRESGESSMTYIDTDELAVRIAEACMGNHRPAGQSAHDLLRQLRELDSEACDGFLRAALSAAEYIGECCNANHPGSVEIRRLEIPRPNGTTQ